MSFVKKGLKRSWKFVKDNWRAIALTAAVVFTAGVATIGFGAFAAAGASAGGMGFGSFMGAVGQTMWAGVAGAAGSMGIGSGATLPAGSALAGGAGTKVGLGAAFQGATGMGSGFGLGKAGAEAALAAQELASATAYQTAYDASLAGVSNVGPTTAAAQQEAAREAGMAAAKKAAVDFTGSGANLTKAGKLALKAGESAGGNTGLAAAKAWGPTIAGTLGPALVGLSEGGNEGSLPWGAKRGKIDYQGPGRNFLEPPPVSAGDDPAAGLVQAEGANAAAQGMMEAQQGRPLMGSGRRGVGLDGRPLDPEAGLMRGYGEYSYG